MVMIQTPMFTWLDTSHVSSKHVKETPKHGPSLSGVDWGGIKRETPKYRPSLMEVDWGGKFEANHKPSEVDWRAHDSSVFLYLEHIDHDGEPKDFFIPG